MRLIDRNEKILPEIIMISPAIILYTVFVIGTLIGCFFLGFTDWNGISADFNFIGFDNYIDIFTNDSTVVPLINTVTFAIGTTVVINICALAFAVLINRELITGNLLRTLFFLPTILSPLVVGYVFSFIFTEPLTVLGHKLGIEVLANNLIGSADWSLSTAIVAQSWKMIGWYMMIYIAGLQTVPKSLYEACDIDGATPWQKFSRVTFPLIAPAFTINMVLSVERAFKQFDLVLALTNGGPGNSSELVSMSIYREAFINRRAGYGSSIGVVLFLIILIVTIIQIVILRRREENAVY